VFNVKSEVPKQMEQICYLGISFPNACTDNQIEAILDGTAEIDGLIVKSPHFVNEGVSADN
jgi:hypothetical protein